MRKILIDGVEREEVTETQLMNEATMIRPALPTFETILVRPESWDPDLPRCIVCGAPGTWIRNYPDKTVHYFCEDHSDGRTDLFPLCPFWKGKCAAPLSNSISNPICPKQVLCAKRPERQDQGPVIRGVGYELACVPFKADLSEDHDGTYEGCIVAYLRPKSMKEGAKAGPGYIGPSIPGPSEDTVTRRGTVLFDKTNIKEAAQDKSWYLRAGVCSKCGREIPEGAGRGLNYPDYICLKCDGKKAEWPITDPDGLEYELRTLITREREKR